MWRRPDSQRLAQRSSHLPRHSLDSLLPSALCHHVKMLSSASPGSRPCSTRAPSPLRSSRIPRGAFSRRWLGTNSACVLRICTVAVPTDKASAFQVTKINPQLPCSSPPLFLFAFSLCSILSCSHTHTASCSSCTGRGWSLLRLDVRQRKLTMQSRRAFLSI